jgi:sugar lactone lactonase YvrE
MFRRSIILLSLYYVASAPLRADGTISTIAGASTQDFVPATSTLVNYPGGVASDGVGNVYISDTGNQRIRRVDASTKIITTIAGTGVAGFSGDNGPATDAQLSGPSGISYAIVGGEECLYVADTGNQRIRRIDISTGIITTVAGTGVATYDPNDDVNGNLAVLSSLNNPQGVFADTKGNLYIADTANNRIRYVNGTSNAITTVAGYGTAGYSGDTYYAVSPNVQLNQPVACALVTSPAAVLYIADTQNYVVRSVSLSTGVIYTAAGNHTYGYVGGFVAANSAEFTQIYGVYPANGIIFITDSNNNRMRYLYGGYVYDWFGNASPGYAGDGGYYYNSGVRINNPRALSVDSNYNPLFVDFSNNCVRRVDYSTTQYINTVAGSGIQDNVPGTNVVLKGPSRVMPNASGQLLIAEQGANKVRSLDPSSGIISTFAGTGTSNYSGDGLTATAASFWGVHALAKDLTGNVFVADNYSAIGIIYTTECFTFFGTTFCFPVPTGTYTYGQSRIRRVDSFGMITTVAGVGAVGTNQLGNTGNGGQAGSASLGIIHGLAQFNTTLYFSDTFYQVLRAISQTTGVIYAFGGVSGTAGYTGDGTQINSGLVEFNTPRGMATDSSGNLYVADSGNNVVRRVSASSLSVTTVCGLGPTHAGYSGDGGQANLAALFDPSDVFVDANNNLFIADSGNSRIRRIDAISNSITTVVGDGFEGFSGDGGPALLSTMNRPRGLYVDNTGGIFVADTGNDRVRKVSYAKLPTPTPLVSGSGKVAAFPSPTNGRICFSYTAPQSGKVEVDIYNVAMQLVAKINDDVSAGTALTCGDVSGLANGVYLYKLTCPGGSFAPNKFKVIH